MSMVRAALLLLVLLAAAFVPFPRETSRVRVASKKFTESVILGEILTQLVRHTSETAAHYRELGGTKLVFDALRNGDIDAYVDYSGTIVEEILAGQSIAGEYEMRERLKAVGIEVSGSLGFNNRYELAMLRERAEALGITRISDLSTHPGLQLGFANEFLDRKDGWQPLKRHYGLPHTNVRGLDHDIAYVQLGAGIIDVMDVYTTDANITVYDITVLEDDREFFPQYEAVILYRSDLAERMPGVAECFRELEGSIDDKRMRAMNHRVVVDRVPESRVASQFLSSQFQITQNSIAETGWTRLKARTLEHVDLVRKSLIPAILCAIPLGVLAARQRQVGQIVLAAVGVVQTIPALALLVFLMSPVHWLGLTSVGQGSFTAVLALFLYSLLPIVRNTYAGLQDVAPSYRESAIAIGLPAGARLRLVELPLASRTILEGIKTAAVINVGFATLGALIGAGGYGQPILTGIRLNNTGLLLEGALPAAAMALIIQWGFDFAEPLLVPKGLRLKAAR